MPRFWKISSKSQKKLSHKSFWLRYKRVGYFGMALIILLSVLSYDLFFNAPKVKAATVDSSSSSTALGTPQQRHEVVTSNGTIVAFFDTGTQDVTGLAYATSTNNGSTWSSATQITSTQSRTFSAAIDGSDNIYLGYDSASIVSSSVYLQKMSYTGGTSWSLGSVNTVVAGTGCVSNQRNDYENPSVAVNAQGTVWVAIEHGLDIGGSCLTFGTPTADSYYSTNLTAWNEISTPTNNSGMSPTILAVGNSVWGAFYNSSSTLGLYANVSGSGSWSLAVSNISVPSTSSVSMTYGLDALHIFYSGSSGLLYQSYNIATGVLSSITTISSSANDVLGQISSDSQNLWVAWQQYVAASSYNVVYERFNGTSWDVSPTSITTDNLNNTSVNLPERMPNTANVPVLWQTGTASPYTLKATTFSTIGTVTDTGNQTGTLSGSLTGSSGDVVVKCGIWYYNTVNIVLGMTVKVCAGNGQTGGTLEIHANTVTVAGTMNGVGRGNPGGAAVYGVGGAAGTGGVRLGAAATAGSAGTSYGGGPGGGSFGGTAGSAGTNDASPGNGGSGGHGGGGGGGAGATNGSGGTNGGYLTAGGNGDGTTDTSLVMGSGGGGGGGGGAGSGGGGGAAGVTGGNGGNGGQGGASLGGLGGDGGASIKLFSTGGLTISGSVSATGLAGSSGTTGGGSTGVTGTGSSPGAGGGGGTAPSGNGSSGVDGASTGGSGGGGGGASGSPGTGGNGAGGGVLLKSTAGGSSITINGTINTSGGSSTTNGGTVKLFSCIEPSTSGITAGRIYANAPGGGANCPPSVPALSFPVNSSNGNTVFTTFNLRSSDSDGDYLNYWIDVCADNACATIIRSICQINTGTGVPGTCTPSQTGWASQDQQAGTAYTGNPTLTLSTLAVHNYQPPLLSANTQYWWRAYAIDPGGSDTWSSASPISTFTTAPTETHIQGNIKIQGNVKL